MTQHLAIKRRRQFAHPGPRDPPPCESQKKTHAVTITIAGADVLDDAFQYPFTSARGPKPFTREHPFHMNYHWRRFRTRGAATELTVSDWIGETDPAGPIGQQLMYNFIEIQPYLDWD